MVFRRTKVARSTFRNLPFGAAYWVAGATGVAPAIKTGRSNKVAGFDTDHITLTAVADTSVGVVRLQKPFLQY